MNRHEMIVRLAELAGLSLPEARRAVRALFSVAEGEGLIADALDQGERVVVTGFGTFQARWRGPRLFRDPGSGRLSRLEPVRVVRFRPGAGLRERLR
ncbi:MAG: HU family DNA-binding protein [Acidobacteria bacterium]|nr:MAG: HU family DNA-binding protein [Acidobacteriota bacterium]